jgi:hypothetical protein
MTSRLSIDWLHWDDWNRDHIAKHAVLPEEVEEVIAGSTGRLLRLQRPPS